MASETTTLTTFSSNIWMSLLSSFERKSPFDNYGSYFHTAKFDSNGNEVSIIFETEKGFNYLSPRVTFLRLQKLQTHDHPNIFKVKNVELTEVSIQDLKRLRSLVDENSGISMDINIAIESQCLRTIFLESEPLGFNLNQWYGSVNGSSAMFNEFEEFRISAMQVEMLHNLLDGVKYLHKSGIVHGDIRDRNIRFSPKGSEGLSLPLKIGYFDWPNKDLDIAEDEKRIRPMDIRTDIYCLGFQFWSILRCKSLSFYGNLKKEGVPGHPVIKNVEELIVQMTNEDFESRLQTLSGVNLIINDTDEVNCKKGIIRSSKISKLNSLVKDVAGSNWFLDTNLISILGSGSFGVVFKVSSKKYRQFGYTALKIVIPSVSRSFSTGEMLHNQSEDVNSKGIVHKNVVLVYQFLIMELDAEKVNEFFTETNFVGENEYFEMLKARLLIRTRMGEAIQVTFMEMELCGRTLKDWLDETLLFRNNTEKLYLDQARIIYDIGQGLSYLHYRNVIHRDLKPANIYFAGPEFEFPLKIGDFGLSQNFDTKDIDDSSSCIAGTPRYMAPEALQGQSSKLSDIFSFGLILWEVIQPIGKADKKEMFRKLVYEQRTEIVQVHPFIANANNLVIKMTLANILYRMQNLFSFKLHCKFPANEWIKPRKEREDLQFYFDVCGPGSKIELQPAELSADQLYYGPYHINQRYLTINGQNLKIMSGKNQCCITVASDNCCITNLCVIGNENEIHHGISIVGGENTVQNIKMKKCGLTVNGNNNSIDNVFINKCSYGINSLGDRNTIKNIRFRNMTHGLISVCGNQCLINGLDCENARQAIFNGNNNLVENVRLRIHKNYIQSENIIFFQISSSTSSTFRNIYITDFLNSEPDESFDLLMGNIYVMDCSACNFESIQCSKFILQGGEHNKVSSLIASQFRVEEVKICEINAVKCADFSMIDSANNVVDNVVAKTFEVSCKNKQNAFRKCSANGTDYEDEGGC